MDLPMEIRLMILKGTTASHGGSLLKLSTVCVQWQEFFEKIVFTNTKLKSFSDIRWCARMMTGRRKSLLQLIWLHVKLWTYNCGVCQSEESAAEAAANSKTFSTRLLQLLDILSTWDIKQNLTLQLSAAFPNDTSHCFGPLIGGQSSWAEPTFHKAYFTQERRYVGSQRRRLGNLLDFDVGNRAIIPEIRETMNFVINRRFQRSLSSGALMNVLRCLPYLEEIVYEPSRGVDFADDIARISAIITLFIMLPRRCKSFNSGRKPISTGTRSSANETQNLSRWWRPNTGILLWLLTH
ncbi:hypothetical protein GQ607_002524 [Colletotrichum asianum]|uniref:F-box domain-containing protein n=1 Tax=Colletotrichum asianum TaxID=702518 RepID=A0A8H3WMQ5_9PEZI|nr:hypothetical protein GQ607_002524 [Colletotrichum asianum]